MQNRVIQNLQLYTETLAHILSVFRVANHQRSDQSRKKEISWQKWNEAGCFEQIWKHRLAYKQRFSSERTFAWIDKFRALQLRGDIKYVNFFGGHHLTFAMSNLRHLFSN